MGGGGGSISDFRIPGQYLICGNFHNSRTSKDIDMKLGSVTKLDKKNTTTLKKSEDDFMSANCDVMVIFFQLIANLEQSRCRIQDALSAKLTFSLIVAFCFTEIGLKIFKHSSYTIAFSEGTVYAKNAEFLQKNDDINKIKGVILHPLLPLHRKTNPKTPHPD